MNHRDTVMYLSPHFTLEEMTASETADRLGLDNKPGQAAIEHLRKVALILECVRLRLGVPIIVRSGYRSAPVNKAVGGAANSQHMTGNAVDFIAPGFGAPVTVVSALVDCPEVEYDQLIQEGRWVHLSWSDRPRREVLTAHFASGGVTYSQGLT